MLNTKNMSAGSGKPKPVIGVGNQVIKINSISLDVTPYDKDAYNVTLHVESKPIDGEQYGWVRGDNVTFQPIKKKSSKSKFEGDFVQKYNNTYQLGADVFPHPNWMVQYRAYAGDEVTSDFGGDFDLDI